MAAVCTLGDQGVPVQQSQTSFVPFQGNGYKLTSEPSKINQVRKNENVSDSKESQNQTLGPIDKQRRSSIEVIETQVVLQRREWEVVKSKIIEQQEEIDKLWSQIHQLKERKIFCEQMDEIHTKENNRQSDLQQRYNSENRLNIEVGEIERRTKEKLSDKCNKSKLEVTRSPKQENSKSKPEVECIQDRDKQYRNEEKDQTVKMCSKFLEFLEGRDIREKKEREDIEEYNKMIDTAKLALKMEEKIIHLRVEDVTSDTNTGWRNVQKWIKQIEKYGDRNEMLRMQFARLTLESELL